MLPYDAEIEYLESTGTQYIDTGIPALANYGYKIVAEITEAITVDFPTLIGAQATNSDWYYALYESGDDLYFEGMGNNLVFSLDGRLFGQSTGGVTSVHSLSLQVCVG